MNRSSKKFSVKAAVTFRKRLRLAGFLSGAVLVIAPVAIELLFYSGSLSPEASLVETLEILAAGGLLGGGAGYVVVEVFHWVAQSAASFKGTTCTTV